MIRLEHGGTNESVQHYETVTYWYGLPSPSLIETDQLQIGDIEAEHSHGYVSPDASDPYGITSRYEWGVDTLNGKTIYPAESDSGRITQGTSEFRLSLYPNNFGALLRRKLDYSFPHQRAEVYIADHSKSTGRWPASGILPDRLPVCIRILNKSLGLRNILWRYRTGGFAMMSF